MKTILVLALDGMMDSSLAITLDTLRTGMTFHAQGSGKASLRLLVAGHGRTVRTGAGMRLTPDLRFADVAEKLPRPDWILLPGLGLTTKQDIATRFDRTDARAAIALLQSQPETVRIGASCSSVFLLARSGLLAGRRATMTWWLARHFRDHHPDIKLDETRMLVSDGRFLTAGSAYSQLDLALAVVTATMGQATAHLCSRYLLIDQRPSQARYMMADHVQHADPTVIAAERWIDAHLSQPISVTDLADALAVSPKTLARRIEAATGASPVKFIQSRRLLHATHLIETTADSIDAVATAVGYQDGTALRKLVKREFGVTPGALRRMDAAVRMRSDL